VETGPRRKDTREKQTKRIGTYRVEVYRKLEKRSLFADLKFYRNLLGMLGSMFFDFELQIVERLLIQISHTLNSSVQFVDGICTLLAFRI